MTEIYLKRKSKCKFCKHLRITIVPPSSLQYCSNLHKYVEIESNGCPDYMFDKVLAERWDNFEKSYPELDD